MIRMNYLDLYVEDEDDVEMEEIADEEENVTDRNFINDSVSFSPSPSFYNRIDNTAEIQNVDRSKIMNCLQKKMILTKKSKILPAVCYKILNFMIFQTRKFGSKI